MRAPAAVVTAGPRLLWEAGLPVVVAHGHKFDPERRGLLTAPERSEYLPPAETLEAFGVEPGWHAADIGCGPGHFTFPLARLVGGEGRVYAVDIEPVMLRDLAERAADAGLENVVIVESKEDGIPLPDDSVDFAFMACVLHELEGPGTLRETRRILRPGGFLGVIDWKKVQQDIGPPEAHRLSPRQAERLLRKGGFSAGKASEVAPYHWGLRCVAD